MDIHFCWKYMYMSDFICLFGKKSGTPQQCFSRFFLLYLSNREHKNLCICLLFFVAHLVTERNIMFFAVTTFESARVYYFTVRSSAQISYLINSELARLISETSYFFIIRLCLDQYKICSHTCKLFDFSFPKNWYPSVHMTTHSLQIISDGKHCNTTRNLSLAFELEAQRSIFFPMVMGDYWCARSNIIQCNM